MGSLKISQLKNQFVKDIANQCDIVKKDGILEGKELSIFKERAQQAVDCNLLKKEDLVSDLQQILGMDIDSAKAASVSRMGLNTRWALEGYTTQSEYYTVTQYIKNLNPSYTKDFLAGYRAVWEECIKYVNDPEKEKHYDLSICEQIATEYGYDEKEEVLRTLCKKVLEDAKRFGSEDTAEYKTVKNIMENKDLVKIAKSGTLDQCMLELIRTFRTDENPSSLIDKIGEM